MKYRKKPVIIDAATVTSILEAATGDWNSLPAWITSAYERGEVQFTNGGIHIKTLEGTMVGIRGDWIIRGVMGELYPCRANIFHATYDPVPEESMV